MAEKRKPGVMKITVSFVRKLPLIEKQCAVCGKTFTGTKKSAYCSTACKSRASYARHATEYRKARMEKYYSKKAEKGGERNKKEARA